MVLFILTRQNINTNTYLNFFQRLNSNQKLTRIFPYFFCYYSKIMLLLVIIVHTLDYDLSNMKKINVYTNIIIKRIL